MKTILLVLFTIFFAVALGTYAGSQVIEVPGDASYLESATLWKNIIVNESGGDYDSRIEGDGDANLIYVDAGNDRVGIGDATPAAKFTVGSGDKFQVQSDGDIGAVGTVTFSDNLSAAYLNFAALDSAQNYKIIDTSGATAISDGSDYIIYDGASDYWDGAGAIKSSASVTSVALAGTTSVTTPAFVISDGTAGTIFEFAAVDTSGNWIGLDFSGGAGFNDGNDYIIKVSGSSYWTYDIMRAGYLIANTQVESNAYVSYTSGGDMVFTPKTTGDPVIATDSDSILSLDSGKATALHGSADGVIRAAARAIAGADTPADVFIGLWTQGTGTLTDGTTDTVVTYIDADPEGEWTSADAEFTRSEDNSYYKEGAESLKIVAGSGAESGDVVVSNALAGGNEDWSDRESVGVWFYCPNAHSSGFLDFRITDLGAGDTDTASPAIAAGTWTWWEFDISGVANASKDAITDIAFIYKATGADIFYFDFLAKWDAADETNLAQNITYDGIRGVDACPIASGTNMAWTAQTEYTDYFINYTSGTDNLVVITDESANCFRMTYLYN